MQKTDNHSLFYFILIVICLVTLFILLNKTSDNQNHENLPDSSSIIAIQQLEKEGKIEEIEKSLLNSLKHQENNIVLLQSICSHYLKYHQDDSEKLNDIITYSNKFKASLAYEYFKAEAYFHLKNFALSKSYFLIYTTELKETTATLQYIKTMIFCYKRIIECNKKLNLLSEQNYYQDKIDYLLEQQKKLTK